MTGDRLAGLLHQSGPMNFLSEQVNRLAKLHGFLIIYITEEGFRMRGSRWENLPYSPIKTNIYLSQETYAWGKIDNYLEIGIKDRDSIQDIGTPEYEYSIDLSDGQIHSWDFCLNDHAGKPYCKGLILRESDIEGYYLGNTKIPENHTLLGFHDWHEENPPMGRVLMCYDMFWANVVICMIGGSGRLYHHPYKSEMDERVIQDKHKPRYWSLMPRTPRQYRKDEKGE